MAKYNISANVDYVMGHLRYGRYTGTIDEKELPEGITIEDLMEDPSLIKDYDLTDFLEFVIDDVDIYEIGPITFVEIKKEEEENVN